MPGTASPDQAPDVPALLAALLRDPGRPRVTWYGGDGERVELSGRTLDNWVAKTANLLVEEYDAGPGTRIEVRLPVHWRTATWLLATWAVGACAVVPGGAAAPEVAPADVVVTADPAAAVAAGADASTVVAVALPALATSFGEALPAGALDGAAEVRLRGDVFTAPVPPGRHEEALVTADGHAVTYAHLLAAARGAGWPPRVRLLTAQGPHQAVRALLAPLVLDGSVVLQSPALDADALARIAVQERTTATF